MSSMTSIQGAINQVNGARSTLRDMSMNPDGSYRDLDKDTAENLVFLQTQLAQAQAFIAIAENLAAIAEKMTGRDL